VCVAALATLTLDRTGFLPLHGRARSSSEKIGEQVGRIAVYAAIPVVALLFLRRRRTKRAAG